MNPDTDIDTLKAIRARADAATAGPWEDLHGGSLLAPLHRICAGPQVLFYRNTTHPKTLQDAAFIAHARTDIPLLLDALATARAQAAAAQGLADALRYAQRQAKVIQETRWGYDGDCGVGAIASRIEDVATAALTGQSHSLEKATKNPQPDYSDLWQAFVAGAREVRLNPQATEPIFQKSADAYCKLIHSQKAPEYCAIIEGKTVESDSEPPVYEGFDSCASRDFARAVHMQGQLTSAQAEIIAWGHFNGQIVITDICIDHVIWKRWHATGDSTYSETALSKLNELLQPHGVHLEKTTGPLDDSFGIQAKSQKAAPSTEAMGVNCPMCGVPITTSNAGGYRTYCETCVSAATAIELAIERFENKERGVPQAHIAAELVKELRNALEPALTSITETK